MLFWLLSRIPLAANGFDAGVCQASNFASVGARAAAAAVISLLMVLFLGPRTIRFLALRLPARIRGDSVTLEKLQRHKAQTPTMGGLLLVGTLLFVTALLADWSVPLVRIMFLVTLGLAGLGAIDDLIKVASQGRGLSARVKLFGQIVLALGGSLLAHRELAQVPEGLSLALPGIAVPFELGLLFVPLAVLTIVGSSNAVNLTDGLDGLATGCLLFAAVAIGAVGWCGVSSHSNIAGGEETFVLLGAMVGTLLGFLWFNRAPARIFMGDTGSLPLGGLLALSAIALRLEWLLAVTGGVFVAEALSVILQVSYFKCTGRRIFLCAPLHHHFQFQGWSETQVVRRFWLAAATCAAAGVVISTWART